MQNFANAGKKLSSVDTSGIDRAVQKASANAAKKLSSTTSTSREEGRRRSKLCQVRRERAAKSVDTKALQKLSANVDKKLSAAKAPSFDNPC